jgi:hypothetical protein
VKNPRVGVGRPPTATAALGRYQQGPARPTDTLLGDDDDRVVDGETIADAIPSPRSRSEG